MNVHDKASPNLAARKINTNHKRKWNVLPNFSYYPNLATSKYRLFGYLMEHMGGKTFAIIRYRYMRTRNGKFCVNMSVLDFVVHFCVGLTAPAVTSWSL